MSDSRFTAAALGAIRLARESAAALGHAYVGSEHLLLGLAGGEEQTGQRRGQQAFTHSAFHYDSSNKRVICP